MAIGVFDSGIGGLTVLHALACKLPSADIIYLADQANTPYGGLCLQFPLIFVFPFPFDANGQFSIKRSRSTACRARSRTSGAIGWSSAAP